MFVKATLRLLSPAGCSARLSILIFHRVVDHPDALHTDLPDAGRFDQTVAWLTRWFKVLPLDSAIGLMAEDRLPARAAAITFDDGYADNATQALPILKRHGVNATFFIATSFLDGGRMWNDTVAEAIRSCARPLLDLRDLGLGQHLLEDMPARRRAVACLLPKIKYLPFDKRQTTVDEIASRVGMPLPDTLMMRSEQVLSLHHAGMHIGAHTVQHPILSQIDSVRAEHEIRAGKQVLEGLLQHPVTLFAFPNGSPGKDYRPEHLRMIEQAGFTAAFTTSAGAARAVDDRFQLPRFTPWDRTRFKFGLRMARNLRTNGDKIGFA